MENQTHNVVKEIEKFTVEQILQTLPQIENETNSLPGQPYYYVETTDQSPLNKMNEITKLSDQMLPPIVVPYYENNIFKGLYMIVIARTGGPIQDHNLQIFYNFTLNLEGKPQLNLYITFNYKRNIDKRDFWFNAIDFNTGNGNINGVDMSGIETVEVFLVDEDPETSRGTVTTVKPTDAD